MVVLKGGQRENGGPTAGAPLRPTGQPVRKASSTSAKPVVKPPAESKRVPLAPGRASPALGGKQSPLVGVGHNGTQATGQSGLAANRRPGAKPAFNSLAGPREKAAKGQVWASSSSKGVGSQPSSAGSNGSARFRRLDLEGTEKAIQETFKKGHRKDVTSMCQKIERLLDDPLLIADEDRAAIVIQRSARGFLVRNRRAAGMLFPVEEQSLVDGKVLLKHYGATVYSLSPRSRRDWVKRHFAASMIQRVARKRLIRGNQNSRTQYGLMQRAAALVLQRVLRGHRARRFCKEKRVRFSKAACFLRFLATDLDRAARSHSTQVQMAASTRVQAWWRGVWSRTLLSQDRVKEEKAAIQVQSLVRGWSTRKLAEKICDHILLKSIIRLWNKMMWTGSSPNRVLQHYPETSTEVPATSEEEVNVSLGLLRVQEDHDDMEGFRRSLFLGDDEDDVVFLGEHNTLGSNEIESAEQEPAACDQEIRSSWKVVMTESTFEQATPSAAPPEWPQEYEEHGVCLEMDAISNAMEADMSAVTIQRVLRGHHSRMQNPHGRIAVLSKINKHGAPSEAQLMTPLRIGKVASPGLPPTPSRPPSGVVAVPVAPTGPASTPPRMSPGTPGSRGRSGLKEWKTAIAQQVNNINEKLVESARKHRSRSRSPNPLSPPTAEAYTACDSPDAHLSNATYHSVMKMDQQSVAQLPKLKL